MELDYEVQRLVIPNKPYNDSINYSKLLSEADESDFVDSFDEHEIYRGHIPAKRD
jgi:hypothetical protein